MHRRAVMAGALLVAGVVAGCSDGLSDGGTRVTLDDGSTALVWGDGEYGVVIAAGPGEEPADWAPLAREIAANRMTVVAVRSDDATTARVSAAADWLAGSGAGVERIAYIGSGTQGAELLAAWVGQGGAVDQLILVSADIPDPSLAALGEPSKLFVASAGDSEGAGTAVRLTETAEGSWNVLLLVPGEARGVAILDGEGAGAFIDGVVARLEERR
jgi:hypothetical protein